MTCLLSCVCLALLTCPCCADLFFAASSCPFSALHDSVSRLTPEEAAKQWMSFVEDTASLLTLFDLDAEMASPLLAAHAAHIMAWLLCLYFFNTHGELTCSTHDTRPVKIMTPFATLKPLRH
jgi:hypothetical protein